MGRTSIVEKMKTREEPRQKRFRVQSVSCPSLDHARSFPTAPPPPLSTPREPVCAGLTVDGRRNLLDEGAEPWDPVDGRLDALHNLVAEDEDLPERLVQLRGGGRGSRGRHVLRLATSKRAKGRGGRKGRKGEDPPAGATCWRGRHRRRPGWPRCRGWPARRLGRGSAGASRRARGPSWPGRSGPCRPPC